MGKDDISPWDLERPHPAVHLFLPENPIDGGMVPYGPWVRKESDTLSNFTSSWSSLGGLLVPIRHWRPEQVRRLSRPDRGSSRCYLGETGMPSCRVKEAGPFVMCGHCWRWSKKRKWWYVGKADSVSIHSRIQRS